MSDITPFTDADVEAVARTFGREVALADIEVRGAWKRGAEAALAALSARLRETERKVLPREPTAEMLAEALPVHGAPASDPVTLRLAEGGLFLLEAPTGKPIPPEIHQLGLEGALTLVADWRAMWDAAP